ncbi:MAG: hypothetical protein RLZ98_3239 [Pseudomonadota bacterium]|jgi:gentisate 1,2-dioxygenase
MTAPSDPPLDSDIRAAWAAANVRPLWESRAAHQRGMKPVEPGHIWHWSALEPLIRQALDLTSMEAIERRVLCLVSPHQQPVGGAAGTVTNINANIQILKPGETARPHRHSMNALRFVLEGEGAATLVDGKNCPMAFGDLVTTPGWCWHEHAHSGEGPCIWLDVLDASLHRYLGTDRFEPGPSNDLPPTIPDAAYASACLVPDIEATNAAYSPVFRYPWADAAAAVARAPVSRDGTRRVRYTNPLAGGPVMAFLDCYLIELEADRSSLPMRTSANSVYAVVEGSGRSTVGEQTFEWGPRDIFSCPHDNWISHRPDTGTARLFQVTDREVLRRLDLLAEEFRT